MNYKVLLFFFLFGAASPCFGQDTLVFCTGPCCYPSEESIFTCRLRANYTYQILKPSRCERYVFFVDKAHPEKGTFKRYFSDFDTETYSDGIGGGTFIMTEDKLLLQPYTFTITAYGEKDSLGHIPPLKTPGSIINVRQSILLKDKPMRLADCSGLTFVIGQEVIRYINATKTMGY